MSEVEHPRFVVVDARWQDLALEDRRRHRRALQLLDGIKHRLESPSSGADAMPRNKEPAERVGVHRFDLVSKARQRSAAENPQHVRVDPLALAAAGPELALHQLAGRGELLDERRCDAGAEAIPRGELKCTS